LHADHFHHRLSQPGREARARNAGAVCFLIKPFVAKTLIGCLESALKGLPR